MYIVFSINTKCPNTVLYCVYMYVYHKADTHASSLCCYHQASASHAAKQADSEALPVARETVTCEIKGELGKLNDNMVDH